jgi:cellulose synthase/poly-beta-1,6-N-acetylglucosamine synthase-like glycosyltransferase
MDGTQHAPGQAERVSNAARFSLSRAAPLLSARRRLYLHQFVVIVVVGAAIYWSVKAFPSATFHAAHALAFAIFTILTVMRLAAAATALAPLPPHGKTIWRDDLPVYSILIPLYREAGMLTAIADRIGKLDYPAAKLDVKLILEADDHETIAACEAISWPAHFEMIIVPAGKPRTKPKALNFALAFARGAFVAIYDAEDAPAPNQLRAALDAFAGGGEDLGCVQAPLVIDNARESWLSAQFAAEYAIQFHETLPFMARIRRPLMLGGTSNHFRAHALAGAGAWDPFNVTEDADLGYRLARDGWRTDVIVPPTHEEAPTRLWPWLRQRSRWIKGHIQTWLVLMRDPATVARELGIGGFLAMQVLLGGSILSAFMHGPILATILWAIVSPTFNLGGVDWALAAAGYATAWYCALTAAACLRDWRIVAAAVTMPFYWPLSSIAAVMALGDLLFRPHHWSKTAHGAAARRHRSGTQTA